MPSLQEILADPNYVNANEATKEAIFNKYAPQDKDYSGANDATKEAIRQRFGLGTAEVEPPEVDAGFSANDLILAAASGVVGAGKSIADVFGADTEFSKSLGATQKELGEKYSTARKQEMARRQYLERKAAESDSLTNEISTFLGGVAEAPLQSLAQGLGSIVPYVGTGVIGKLANLGAPTLRALNLAVGTAQGAGTIKGTIYDNVKDELVKSGMSEREAEEKASKAQSYLGENFLDIAAGAGLGAFGAKYGVEELLAQKLAAREVTKKGMARRIIEAGAAEAPMEGLQAGQEQLSVKVPLMLLLLVV